MEKKKATDPVKYSRQRFLGAIAVTVLLIVGFTVYNQLTGGVSTTDMHFGETEMILTASSDEDTYTIQVSYTDILEVQLMQDDAFDPGQRVAGIEGKRLWCGKWHNESMGDYEIYADPRVKTWVVFKTGKGYVLLNTENEKTTTALKDAIKDLLEK